MIKDLKNISAKHFFPEKILVCPSFEIVYQILENLAGSGYSWINFRAETTISLAAQITETRVFKRNLKAISAVEANFLMDEIFTKLSEERSLKYFKKFYINKGMVKALSENIAELKFAGITPEQLDSTYFINEDKAQDLKNIFYNYENLLKEKSLIDSASMVNLANSILSGNFDSGVCDFSANKIFIVSAKYNYKKIEKDFLNNISGGRLIVIEEEKIHNLERPKNRFTGTHTIPKDDRNVSRFSFLFDQQNKLRNIQESNDNIDIEIFHAPNYRSEIYEILRRISIDRMHIDNIELVYTNPEPYLDLIKNITEKLGVPVSFSSGLPGDKSRVGKCLKGFLLWIKDDFLEEHLRNLLNYNLLKFEGRSVENKIDGSELAFMLRTSKIGWGRERYCTVLERSISEITAKIEKEKEDSKPEDIINNYEYRLKLLKSLKEITASLLQIIPEIKNGKVNFKQLCDCALKFLSGFIKVSGEDEALFLKSLKNNILTMKFIVEMNVPAEEAILKIIELIRDIRFLKSGPQPGCLFVSDLGSGGISGRGSTFIVGMDENKFPGTQVQDPVLLDEERIKISSNIGLFRASLKEKLYDFTSMLSGLKGRVSFSYSFYDIKEEKHLYPSSVLLQIYREQSKDNDADYDNLLSYLGKKEDAKLKSINAIHIDESDFWMGKLLSEDNLKNARKSVLKIYPWLKEGITAFESRKSSKLTSYDGWVNPSSDELDPRKNKDIILSCTGIESFAQSPFTYFLEKILCVRRPEEIKKDLSIWLNPKIRGVLLHDVFQNYSEKIKSIDLYPDQENRKKLIYAILDKKIKKFKEDVPIPGKAVFNQEVANLERDIDVFLKINDELGKAFLLEYEFGCRGKEKVVIDIGKDNEGNDIFIGIAGKIDRVDEEDVNNYHVWDYKTGSSYSYDEEGYVSQGKQLQHILYAKVIEKILKKTNPDARVSMCGYIFPTEKGRSSGKGCIFRRNTDEKEKWQGALNCILDLMASGVFIFSDEDMSFFDDADIYGSKSDKQNTKEKINDEENTAFEKWKELKKYK